MSTAGEFSNAVTDCGLWVNGVGQGVRYDGTYVAGSFPDLGSCTPWTDWQNYNSAMKTAIKNFALASMDALQVRQTPVQARIIDTNFGALVVIRTTSSGHGRSVTQALQGKSKLPPGRINWVSIMGGCPRILETLTGNARMRTLGNRLSVHGKPVALERAASLRLCLRPSHGHHLLSATPVLLVCSPSTHPLARYLLSLVLVSLPRVALLSLLRPAWAVVGRTRRTALVSWLKSRLAVISIHGWTLHPTHRHRCVPPERRRSGVSSRNSPSLMLSQILSSRRHRL